MSLALRVADGWLLENKNVVAGYAGAPDVESSSTEIYKHVLSKIVECRGQVSGFKVVWRRQATQ